MIVVTELEEDARGTLSWLPLDEEFSDYIIVFPLGEIFWGNENVKRQD